MSTGIRTSELRKIYSSAPPLASGGGFGFSGARGKGNKQPKPHIVALDGISLEVLPGEIFGLLGPNGAGKTTTVGVLTTRVRPSGGRATGGGVDVVAQPVRARAQLAAVPQRSNLDRAISIRANLMFHA